MRFGSRQLPVGLRVARSIAYCQAAIVVLIAAFALEVVVLGGTGTGFPLGGLLASTTVTGSGVMTLTVVCLAVAACLAVAEQQAGLHGGNVRLVLAGAELAVSVYLVGFLANSVGAWIFGPACAVAVLTLHYWPELKAYFFAPDAATPVPASPEQPVPATRSGSGGAAPPPL
jgi:hypothetical protein